MSQERQIPRLDPENHMWLDFHAGRALRRFEHIADTEERRAAIQTASFRNTSAHVGEAERMRIKILTLLDQVEGKRTPEQSELLRGLLGQYGEAVSVWEETFPIDTQNAPSKVAVDEWLNSLSAKTLDGILAFRSSAKLVIVPDLTVETLVRALDANKTILGQIDSEVWWPEGWNGVRAPKWIVAITCVKGDMPFDLTIFYENPYAPKDERKERSNEEMVAQYESKFAKKGLGLMPQYGYVPTMMSVLAKKQVIDSQSITAFKKPFGVAVLPFGRWYSNRINLGEEIPCIGSVRHLRCRPWVEGDFPAAV